jgi:biotin operon repressor
MRKVVSTVEGYTFFIGEKKLRNDQGKYIGKEDYCYYFETGKQMSGSDIADSLEISRSAVSQSLKRSLTTIYYALKKKNKLLSPVEIMLLVTEILEIETEEQYIKLFKLLPTKIKGEVCKDAFREFRESRQFYKN